MRMGLASSGIATAWANDIEPSKREIYRLNFGSREFVLRDVREVSGSDLPEIQVATASFPCTDLSLAGNRNGLKPKTVPTRRRGLDGGSSMFWEFARVIDEMGGRRPEAVLLENVLGFASSRAGHDLRDAIWRLNALGYSCDLLEIDARHFVPQSRPRMFILGLQESDRLPSFSDCDRPRWAKQFVEAHPGARTHAFPLPPLPIARYSLDRVVDRLPADHPEWWDQDRIQAFTRSLSPIQSERLAKLITSPGLTWRTAYRRTRQGTAVWEIRRDEIAGCLRTAKGGSSKQALVEAGGRNLRVRWMTPNEYARLMGADEFKLPERRSQALFGFGDAVCVPVIQWICEHYLTPALGARRPSLEAVAA